MVYVNHKFPKDKDGNRRRRDRAEDYKPLEVEDYLEELDDDLTETDNGLADELADDFSGEAAEAGSDGKDNIPF